MDLNQKDGGFSTILTPSEWAASVDCGDRLPQWPFSQLASMCIDAKLPNSDLRAPDSSILAA